MNKLKESFTKNGMRYSLLTRCDQIAIYEQWFENTFVGYEVHEIQSHNGLEIAGKEIPATEYLCSNEQFGKKAFFYKKVQDALAKSRSIKKHLINKSK